MDITIFNHEEHIDINNMWDQVLDNYFEKLVRKSLDHEGIFIFVFLNIESDPIDCELYFVKKDGEAWKNIMHSAPNSKKILENYKKGTNMIVCIQIPDEQKENKTIGNMDLVSLSSKSRLYLTKNN